MKINRLPLLMIAAAVICALLGGCAGARAQTRDSVSVWYIEGDALAGPLAQAASEYNGAVEDGLLGVSLRSFSDEEALSAAFDLQARQHLLLFGQELPGHIGEVGKLGVQPGNARGNLGQLVEQFAVTEGRKGGSAAQDEHCQNSLWRR